MSVVAAHPRAEAGQIKRAGADKTGYLVYEEMRARGRRGEGKRDDLMQRAGKKEGGCAVITRLECRIVPRRHPGNVLVLDTAWMEGWPLD